MDRDCLALRAQIIAEKELEKYIEEQKRELQQRIDEKQKEYEHMKQIVQSQQEAKFVEFYGESPDFVTKKYAKRLRACCGQSEIGYKWWLNDGKYHRYKPKYYNCVVLDYEKAQPSQQERDAYWVMTGTEMKVTEKPHRIIMVFH